jgi:hypothetical protein
MGFSLQCGDRKCRDGRLLGIDGGIGKGRGGVDGVLGDETTVWWVSGTE